MEGKPRGNPEIITGILSNATDGQGPHSIAFETCINSATFRRYANALVKAGFMEQTGRSTSKVVYSTSSKGLNLLNSLKNAQNGLEEFNQYW